MVLLQDCIRFLQSMQDHAQKEKICLGMLVILWVERITCYNGKKEARSVYCGLNIRISAWRLAG